MNKQIPDEVIDEIRERIDIVELISDYVVLKKVGQNLVGHCPFHQEKTPSFTVSPAKQIFHCFGCGVGGNVFSFLMKIEGFTFPETVKFLAERLGIRLFTTNQDIDTEKEERAVFYELNDAAVRFYEKCLCLNVGRQARDYLKQRGISTEVIKKFKLGYAPSQPNYLAEFLRKQGYSLSAAETLGLVKKTTGGYLDRLRHRLIFPIHDAQGRTIGFGGRILDSGQPKYLNSSETPVFRKSQVLYGMHLAKKAVRLQKNVLVVEGYMDVIAAHQFGFENVVASLGTSFTEGQARLLVRYASEILICYDADAAGTEATLRGLNLIRDIGCEVRVLQLPSGFDPDDFFRQKGRDAFLEILTSNNFSLIEYKLKQVLKKYGIRTVSDKVKIINQLIPDLIKTKNAVARQGYIELIAQNLQTTEQAIIEELRRNLGKTRRFAINQDKNTVIKHNNGKVKENGILKAERGLIGLMLEKNEVREKVRETGGYTLFSESWAQELVFCLMDSLEVPLPVDKIVNQVTPETAQILLEISLHQESDPVVEPLEVAADYIRVLKERNIRNKIIKKQHEIKTAELEGDSVQLKTVLSEINELYHELNLWQKKG